MGYVLSSLGSLPFQAEVRLYVFVVGGGWRSGTYDELESNFLELARRIGPSAIVAKGFNPVEWSRQVCKVYLGGAVISADGLPALLITDSHPDQLDKDSLRLLVPLQDAEKRFGSVTAFFEALCLYSQDKDVSFLQRFEDKGEGFGGRIWSALELKPGMFGFSVNIKRLFNKV
ncbi:MULTISPECIES: hypothetical protein [Pseudomonas]|uniref:hypothetical protein n=1 Tax=Pseudomonas TaxID=286 RepID=UPI00131A4B72|nr:MULTISPECIES: hypothetical protein [Pseudomonas]